MPSIDAPGHEGGVCSLEDGYTTCSGGYGTTCCRGLARTFNDGPCAMFVPRDAASMCPEGGSPATAGCPCDEEGALACPTGGWRLDCEGGTWRERTSFMCCS